jgi:hypothetical protein
VSHRPVQALVFVPLGSALQPPKPEHLAIPLACYPSKLCGMYLEATPSQAYIDFKTAFARGGWWRCYQVEAPRCYCDARYVLGADYGPGSGESWYQRDHTLLFMKFCAIGTSTQRERQKRPCHCHYHSRSSLSQRKHLLREQWQADSKEGPQLASHSKDNPFAVSVNSDLG